MPWPRLAKYLDFTRVVAVSGVVAVASGTFSVASSVGVPTAAHAASVPIEPARLLDTRDGTGGRSTALAAGETVTLQVSGRGGVPTGAAGAALNVTVTEPGGPGFVTVFPCGSGQPPTSNLNFVAGQTVPNSALVGLGTGGTVCLHSSQRAHLVVDVTAWFASGSPFVPLSVPQRLVDTRLGIGAAMRPLAADERLTVAVRGRPGVGSDAVAAVVNLTATEPSASGFVTAFPCDQGAPATSNLNYAAGQTVPNGAVISLSGAGSICVFSHASSHVIVDLMGYMTSSAEFRPLAPERILDTRSGVGAPAAKVGWRVGSRTELQVVGRGGVPSGTGSAIVNLTVTNPTDSGWVAAWPCDRKYNGTSILNFEANRTVANLAVVPASATGTICLFAFTVGGGNVDLVGDVTGWLPGPVAPADNRFATLGAGQALPSDVACAAAVRPVAENKAMNVQRNRRIGSARSFAGQAALFGRVTGNFVGTTDEILQWTACKWGIEEDIVRAQAAAESTWDMGVVSDFTNVGAYCAPNHQLGVDGHPGQCPQSTGILQASYRYYPEAYPDADLSTAFNADLGYAVWRSCFEGNDIWLNTVDHVGTYAAGDQWGCIGKYFAGRWYSADAVGYIDGIKSRVASRIWEKPEFQQP